jgi:hypothetical protein
MWALMAGISACLISTPAGAVTSRNHQQFFNANRSRPASSAQHRRRAAFCSLPRMLAMRIQFQGYKPSESSGNCSGAGSGTPTRAADHERIGRRYRRRVYRIENLPVLVRFRHRK